MATSYGGFQLGLLPERKVNKRAMMTSYALVTLLLLIVINIGLILPPRRRWPCCGRSPRWAHRPCAPPPGRRPTAFVRMMWR